MHRPEKHMTDDPSQCWLCKNFKLVPVWTKGCGLFRCENKNSPDNVRTCFNFDERELPAQSFEIIGVDEF